MVDRAYLAEVAHRGPSLVFATISGAHLYGLPAQIDFVLKATGQPSLALIGHSQAGSVGYRGGGR